MKSIILVFKLLLFVFIIAFFQGCEDILETKAYSELTSQSILESEEGINEVLYSAYSTAHMYHDDVIQHYFWSAELSAGISWSQKGAIEVWFKDYENFTWNSDHQKAGIYWNVFYRAIRDANLVIANIDNATYNDEQNKRVNAAEAKFIRGYSYYQLYKTFGTVPLIKTPTDVKLPRATDEEMRSSIEQDLIEAAADLPIDGVVYGRATKGSALGILSKFYLNTKQWEKSAAIAKEIIDSNTYDLVDNYRDIFTLENEGNEEMLWASTFVSPGAGHFANALIFPIDYPLPYPNNQVFAAETFYFDSFINSFDEIDERKDLFVFSYVSTESGETVTLLGNDRTVSAKYPFDPNAEGAYGGNDIPIVRYADILLSRAEALNELNGPNAESIALINQVRQRSNAPEIALGDFSKESLRNHILDERTWEFYGEAKAREDQIRHGVFISNARERGINAQEFHTVFPIPQAELDASPAVIQTEGY